MGAPDLQPSVPDVVSDGDGARQVCSLLIWRHEPCPSCRRTPPSPFCSASRCFRAAQQPISYREPCLCRTPPSSFCSASRCFHAAQQPISYTAIERLMLLPGDLLPFPGVSALNATHVVAMRRSNEGSCQHRIAKTWTSLRTVSQRTYRTVLRAVQATRA